MSDFSESLTGFRLLMQHPIPWKYIGGTPAAIVDANEKVIVTETQVSSVVFDAIWAVYFDLLRE